MSKESKDYNTIFVGQKPTKVYAFSVLEQHNRNVSPIFLKARGRSMQKAIDVSQLVINKYIKDLKVTNVELGTEERDMEMRDTKEIRKINISTITIELKK